MLGESAVVAGTTDTLILRVHCRERKVAVAIAPPAPVDMDIAIGFHTIQDEGVSLLAFGQRLYHDRTAGLQILGYHVHQHLLVHIVLHQYADSGVVVKVSHNGLHARAHTSAAGIRTVPHIARYAQVVHQFCHGI